MKRGKLLGLDLMKLAELLRTHNLCKDASELDNAGNICLSRSDDKQWGYSLSKIVFNVDKAQGQIPEQAEDIVVSLTIPEIEGTFHDGDALGNPLNKLKFNVEIEGRVLDESKNDITSLYGAWHLDKHITEGNSGVTSFSHPLYHLAYGGYHMEERGHSEYGISLIMPAPRIFYPPMDAVLGIDFILQNYVSRKALSSLLSDSDYIRITKSSQQRLWKPFFCSMYSYWNNQSYATNEDFGPFKLFPLYQDPEFQID